MPFSNSVKEEALVSSRRCCCFCHEFAGVYTNVHHIMPEASGGPNTIDNAIVLCLRCHREVGDYDAKHPIGNKYSKGELIKHRDKWWDYCERNPTKALPSWPISISPNSFGLVASEWKTPGTLKITNQSEEIFYDVAVKLFIKDEDIDVKDIKIEPRKKKLFDVTEYLHGLEFSGDVLRLNGNDQEGNEICVIHIPHIDQREVLSFTVTNEAPKSPFSPQKHYLVFTLLGYSEASREMLLQETQAAILFQSNDWTLKNIEDILYWRS